MFDDIRFDTFSYRGGPEDIPNIDQLASESTRFDNAMSTTGLCSPSRAALTTARYPHKIGSDFNLPVNGSLAGIDTNEESVSKKNAARERSV